VTKTLYKSDWHTHSPVKMECSPRSSQRELDHALASPTGAIGRHVVYGRTFIVYRRSSSNLGMGVTKTCTSTHTVISSFGSCPKLLDRTLKMTKEHEFSNLRVIASIGVVNCTATHFAHREASLLYSPVRPGRMLKAHYRYRLSVFLFMTERHRNDT